MSLPNNYVRLDYIKASGTQFIDTGYKPTHKTKIETIYKFDDLHDGNTIGYVDSGTTSTIAYGINIWSIDLFFGYNASKNAGNWNTNKHIYKIDLGYLYVDDVQISAISTSAFTCGYNFKIFAWVRSGEIIANANAKLYTFKMYENNVLIRDYIPAKNKSTGDIGLYDLVNNTFYTNDGTGAFTYGNELIGNVTIVDNPIDLVVGDTDLELTANFKKIGGKKYLIGS